MIRYLTVDEVYYSLNDVSKWLVLEQLLTKDESEIFKFQCKAHVVKKLSNAYEEQCVYQHLEPIVLPINDYFVHWIVWADLLLLLPGDVGRHRRVHTLNLLLGNPETVYLHPQKKNGITLVRLNDKLLISSN